MHPLRKQIKGKVRCMAHEERIENSKIIQIITRYFLFNTEL